jgi:hypothetical protein
LSISHHASAQDIRAVARVDSNNILIGDWLRLHIEVQHAAGITMTFPALADSLQGMEIIHRDTPTVKNNGQQVLETASYTITAFDSGTYIIPPMLIHYTVGGDTTRRVAETSPIPIFVHGIAVDTTQAIKDVKPPLSVPVTFADVLPYLIGIAGAGGIAWLIYYIYKKRKRGERFIPEPPARPPQEIALEALRALEAEHLWQRGKLKEYHSQLTDIVRLYIERRFDVLAMESTSDEILSSMVNRGSDKDVLQLLREILVRADLAKFAKFQPTPEENESSLRLAVDFVERTWRPVLEQARPEPAGEVVKA